MENEKPKNKKRKPREEFPVHTGQETDVIMRAAAHGQTGAHWSNDIQGDAYVFGMPALSHFVRLELTAKDVRDGQDLEWLHDLRGQQDSDSALALLFIARQMITVQPTPDAPTTNIVLDLDDIIEGIGFDPRSTTQRIAARRRIWGLIQFGERARIVGARKGSYQEKSTGKAISTEISTAPWRILQEERPEQRTLDPRDEIPVKVELAPSNEFLRLLLSPDTAQFLPFGEVLGAIPPAKPSGAWARVIGLSLDNFWRRFPRESLDGTRKPTRRELLTHYPPRTGIVEDILSGPNPRYAIQYWAGALEILCEAGFLEKTGEAASSYDELRADLDGYKWQEAWLDGYADVQPSALLREALASVARGLPQSQPRALKRSPKKTKKAD